MQFMQKCGSVRTLDYNLLEKLLRGSASGDFYRMMKSTTQSPTSVP